MGKVSKIFKSIVRAVVKVVKVIVKVVVFIVKAVVNFVKGVFKGDIGSIVMLIAIVFTWGAALGLLGATLTISTTTAAFSTGFTVLASEYQRQKAEKMQKQAESDLEQQQAVAEEDLAKQAAAEEERLNNHFDQMENERYQGYESGTFGIGSFEPVGVLPGDSVAIAETKSNPGILIVSGLLIGALASHMIGE